MTSDRWLKIEEIYHAALQVAENQRAIFLDQACQGDQGLRREVESLLASDAQAADFMEAPAVELLARGITDIGRSSLIGQQLGTYQILSPLGAGGMGEVYKARDTRLNRTVAIKILSRQLTEPADLRQRFEREAHLLASLNHPNIASIYGVEESSGIQALVIELVEGPTLAERIEEGPVPIDEALRIARQMAEALEYAHEKGMVHRDLKPANVKLTAEGAVKVLDFGLAKALEGGTTTGDLENSPTLAVAATESGVILGTAAYMAPEQARGKAVDRRADIWSFGVVLYEMLTGRRLYSGATVSDTLAAVLKMEPDWNALPAEVPHGIRRLLRRCLRKDRQERLQAIGDARIEINDCLSAPAGGAEAEAIALKPVATGRRREQLAWGLAVAFLIAGIVSTVSYLRLARAPTHAIISEIPPPEKTQSNFAPVLSPDGRTLAFLAADEGGKSMLWVRPLDSTSARLLPGTEGGGQPFWSANGRALGFYADGTLKTIEASGGPVVVVADAPAGMGGSWNRDGTLLFVRVDGKSVCQVAASSGTPVPVLELDPSKYSFNTLPRFLPDGKHFLYSVEASDPAFTGIYFASLDGKENRLLVRGGGGSAYASGLLLYLSQATLLAQAFDPERGQLTGDPHRVAEQIDTFDTSENGVLVYQGGGSGGERRLRWFDRTGKELGVIGEASTYWDVRLSPDGAKLAFSAGDKNTDIWVEELARGVRMRLTNTPGIMHGVPIWSSDGTRILFGATQGKPVRGIYQKRSNGAGGEELLLPMEASDFELWPSSWSRDGRFMLYLRKDFSDLNCEIWMLPLAGEGKPRLFVKAPVSAYDGQFSPDDRWVAYASRESGREEVYVVPFEAANVLKSGTGSVTSPGGKWQVSPGGGGSPRWRRDGKEIFYLDPGNQMMAAEVEVRGNSFEVRKAQPLFRAAVAAFFSPYDVTPDGKRFVINTTTYSTNKSLTLVVNWTALLDNKP